MWNQTHSVDTLASVCFSSIISTFLCSTDQKSRVQGHWRAEGGGNAYMKDQWSNHLSEA